MTNSAITIASLCSFADENNINYDYDEQGVTVPYYYEPTVAPGSTGATRHPPPARPFVPFIIPPLFIPPCIPVRRRRQTLETPETLETPVTPQTFPTFPTPPTFQTPATFHTTPAFQLPNVTRIQQQMPRPPCTVYDLLQKLADSNITINQMPTDYQVCEKCKEFSCLLWS